MNENDREWNISQRELTPPSSENPNYRDTLFGDFEDEDFEESDRDSDFASMYTEVEEDEPELVDDEDEELIFETLEAGDRPEAARETESGEDRPFGGPEQAPADTPLPRFTGTDNPMEDWEEDESEEEDESRETSLPVGLILVGLIALILLGAGGYGVVQQRTAMENQIRNLQAALTTAEAQQQTIRKPSLSEEMTARNEALTRQVEQLERENRSLQAIVAGLEKQLQVQQEALETSAPPPPSPGAGNDRPAATGAAAATPAPASSDSHWFVNFGSYSRQGVAASWADRIQPQSGDVVVTTGSKEGQTFYRVRVVNLGSKESADATARTLAQEYGLPPLWVGRVD